MGSWNFTAYASEMNAQGSRLNGRDIKCIRIRIHTVIPKMQKNKYTYNGKEFVGQGDYTVGGSVMCFIMNGDKVLHSSLNKCKIVLTMFSSRSYNKRSGIT